MKGEKRNWAAKKAATETLRPFLCGNTQHHTKSKEKHALCFFSNSVAAVTPYKDSVYMICGPAAWDLFYVFKCRWCESYGCIIFLHFDQLKLWCGCVDPSLKHCSWTNTGGTPDVTGTKNCSLWTFGRVPLTDPLMLVLLNSPTGTEQSCICVGREWEKEREPRQYVSWSPPEQAKWSALRSEQPATNICCFGHKWSCKSYKFCLHIGLNHCLWNRDENFYIINCFLIEIFIITAGRVLLFLKNEGT